jgi:hypothetical protein
MGENQQLKYRLISLQYSDICRGCGKVMPIGTTAVWFNKKDGVKHFECYIRKNTLVDMQIDW